MITVGTKIKYYPAIRDSRYFMFVVTEGDAYDGHVMEVSVTDGLAKIRVIVSPALQINVNNVQVFDTLPATPASYGFAVKA